MHTSRSPPGAAIQTIADAAPSRRRGARNALALAGAGALHALVLAALLATSPQVRSLREAPPVRVQLQPRKPPPRPRPPPPQPEPRAEPLGGAASQRPSAPAPAGPAPPRQDPHAAPPMAARPAPAALPAAVASNDMSAAELAGAQMAGEGRGGGAEGDAGSGNGGGGAGPGAGCSMLRRLQGALRRNARVQAAAAARAAEGAGRPVVVWRGEWVKTAGEEGKGLAGVRQAITLEIAFAPQACRAETLHGFVLIPMAADPGAPRLALGAPTWRWSDLLEVRPR